MLLVEDYEQNWLGYYRWHFFGFTLFLQPCQWGEACEIVVPFMLNNQMFIYLQGILILDNGTDGLCGLNGEKWQKGGQVRNENILLLERNKR